MSLISRKNQVTVPIEMMREAGLEPGDDVLFLAAGPGRLELVRTTELLDEFAGDFTSEEYPPGYLEELRREWE